MTISRGITRCQMREIIFLIEKRDQSKARWEKFPEMEEYADEWAQSIIDFHTYLEGLVEG